MVSDGKEWFFVVFLVSVIMLCNGIFSIGYEKDDFEAPYISNKEAFSYELAGDAWKKTDVWVDKWFFDQPAPFKYRVLGKIPILATCKVLSYFDMSRLNAFYYAYLAWTNIFICCFLFYSGKFCVSLISKCNLALGVNNKVIFYITTSSLALSPPVLFAFKFPVHAGANDFLAYLLISLSLLALIETNIYRFVCCVLIGMFSRETNLLVLVPFVLMKNISSTQKWSVLGLVSVVFLCYRLLWPGSYDPLGGSLHNFEHPLESVLFLFMTFGPFWVLGWLGHREVLASLTTKNHFIQALNKSYYISIAIVTLIVFSLARVREIRIEFILFFYFIPYGVLYCIVKFNKWLAVFNSYKFVLALLAVAGITLAGAFVLMPTDLAGYLSRFGGWKSLFLLHLAISLTVLAVVFLTKQETARQAVRPGAV